MPQPTKQNPNVKLPVERVIKLKELSDALGGASMSKTIGELLKLAQTQGLITSGIPGVEIRRASDGVAIRFDDGPHVPYSNDAAKKFADTIRQFLDGQKGMVINVDDNFIVGRRGSSFKVGVGLDRERLKTWSPDVAQEFAVMLDAKPL